MKAKPITMWAAICSQGPITGIVAQTIKQTKRDSRSAFLYLFSERYDDDVLSNVHFARVTVAEVEK